MVRDAIGVGLALVALSGAPALCEDLKAAAPATTMRCGWFDNPTPGNASLWDKDGEWTVGVQGGFQAEGDWPTFKRGQQVRHGSGDYAFGCACLKARFDATEKNVLAIVSSQAKPLAVCRHAPALVKIERTLR